MHPEWIIDTYDNVENRFIDYTSAYIVVVILIYYSVKYVRHHYDFEKKSAEDRAIAIEQQNQQILEQNSQLERLNVEKNKLFSIVAHDLRTPLGSIQGYLELLSEVSLEESEKQRIEKDLLDITMNTSDMLSNLLSWSKAQMDGVTVRRVLFNLYEVLHKTLEIEKTIALNKGIAFDYDVDKTITLQGDIDMIQLIIRNLVSN
ncbi:MAG TPA: two-component sensor histidine kinase, partial [Sphingobacteriaceae bacterium]|nr:two-component sensor histidine kinase [Sphingobacteriaceae bacterium]